MAPLGFGWQVSQPAPVAKYYANANGTGLDTAAQVQALNVGVQLLQRNPATGVFKLTIGVKKSSHLSLPFFDFPMNAPGISTVLDAQGKPEFQFSVPDGRGLLPARVAVAAGRAGRLLRRTFRVTSARCVSSPRLSR